MMLPGKCPKTIHFLPLRRGCDGEGSAVARAPHEILLAWNGQGCGTEAGERFASEKLGRENAD